MSNAANAPLFSNALRFWERGRILYNAVLTVVVLLWIALTWPHFRPAMTLGSLEVMVFLALLANVCYCAAYLVEFFMQALLPEASWRRFRQTLWVLGMLFALLLANYWIVDEIYPYANQPPPPIIGQGANVPPTIATNMNFPAPLAVLGFLGVCGGLFVALASILIFWFARKPKFARVAAYAIAGGAVVYCALLFGFSIGSRATTLARGQEKYFCEFDCHLAYSIVDVHAQDVNAQPGGRYVVTLRTRFDETTISPKRPKDATLTPSPREVRLVDAAGREYAPVAIEGTPLLTPLKPADSYTTELRFDVPKDATGLRLLLNTTPGWPDHVVIGDENSWLHKKTYFAL
jgi:hypothetical protein